MVTEPATPPWSESVGEPARGQLPYGEEIIRPGPLNFTSLFIPFFENFLLTTAFFLIPGRQDGGGVWGGGVSRGMRGYRQRGRKAGGGVCVFVSMYVSSSCSHTHTHTQTALVFLHLVSVIVFMNINVHVCNYASAALCVNGLLAQEQPPPPLTASDRPAETRRPSTQRPRLTPKITPPLTVIVTIRSTLTL